MPAIEEGRVCIKTTGRNAGEKVVILKTDKTVFVEVASMNGVKQKCNIRHLFPTKETKSVSSLTLTNKKTRPIKKKQQRKRIVKEKPVKTKPVKEKPKETKKDTKEEKTVEQKKSVKKEEK